MQTQRGISDRRTVWSIDGAHTTVEFAVKNFIFFTAQGRFEDVAGTLWLDGGDIGRSTVEVVIKAASIDTGIKRRDAHLRAADFLSRPLFGHSLSKHDGGAGKGSRHAPD